MNTEHNPYSPTKTALGTEPGASPRPRAVDIALVLLTIIICLGVLAAIRDWPLFNNGSVSGLDMLLRLVSLVMLTWICFALTRGRNWGRILLLIIAVLNLFSLGVALWKGSSYLGAMELFHDPVWIGMLVQPALLYLVTIYLLFFRARAWFARSA